MYTVEDWIADLRSGKYKQGPSRLRTITDEFCCLGVAAHNMSTGILNEMRNTYHYDGSAHLLSPRLAELLGLVHTDGTFDWRTLPNEIADKVVALPRNGGSSGPFYSALSSSLTILNDYGVPFALIADIIEARPKGLFKS